MEIEEVETMILEPFDLHTSEHLNNHSPSEYLSANFKFYLPTENVAKSLEDKEEGDVDALWTKAVDNMFKSSRLFNTDVKEEEKENFDENLLDGNSAGAKEASQVGNQAGADDQTLNGEESFLQEHSARHLAHGHEAILERREKKTIGANGDQIVPIAKGFAQPSSLKRKSSDLDVSFKGLPSMNGRTEFKKMKIDPITGKNFIEEEGAVGDYAPPRHSTFADYSFDPNARLPSFREAFVPALKRISRRERELRRNLKNGISSKERAYTHIRGRRTCNGTPAEGQSKSESGNQPSRSDTGVSLVRGNSHHEDVLSEISEMKQFETIGQQRQRDLSPSGAMEQSTKAAEISRFDDELPKSDLKVEIKQEDTVLMDCNKNASSRSISESPDKLLGISSANLKDIEKNIFSFDEGLEILDLEGDFPLHNIAANSHEDALGAIQGSNEADWSINLSRVSDVHPITGHHQLIDQHEKEVTNFINNQSKSEEYLSTNGQIRIPSSLDHAFSGTPVTSYSVPLHHSDSTVLSHFAPPHPAENEGSKCADDMKRFDIIGQSEDHQHQDMKLFNVSDFDMVHRDKRLPDISLPGHQNQTQYARDIDVIKQPLSGMQGNSGIEGQMIARQIHQSFGADVFGAPGDDGAKILAKYLAQRGSTRPDDQEKRGGMTSAIASLISKSFSQQEANQRLQRDSNSAMDFLHAADFENLDLINEHF